MNPKRRRSNNNEDDADDEQVAKKIRTLKDITNPTERNILKAKPERCNICKQNLDNIPLYNGHPDKSNEEFIALTDEKLSIFTDQGEFPTHKITNFSVYDRKGHLCGFDAGLIEKDVNLRFSGYIKKIDDEDPSITDGVPAHDLGPILEWYTTGYDGGNITAICFTTEFAEYFLMDSSLEYTPIFHKICQKIKLVKVVVEFLLDNCMNNPTYEDLARHIENIGEYEAVEELLIQHAQFVCDQVVNLDNAEEEEEERPLISLPCMRSLVKLAGVTFKQRKRVLKLEAKEFKSKRPRWTKAVTTKFVREFFGKLFLDQLDNNNETKKLKKQKCGVCEACQAPDCGNCSNCKDMLKFGGTGKMKQSCKQRTCPYMAILDAEISDNEEETDQKVKTKKMKRCCKKIIHKNIEWGEKAENKFNGFNCYSSVTVGDMKITVGDFVTVKSEPPTEPLWVVKVVSLYESSLKKFNFHGLLFCRGKDTILAGTADPQEIFLVDECEDLYLGCIFQKAEVKYIKTPENWSELGGTYSSTEQQEEDDGENFYFSKRYESKLSRFVDIRDEEINEEGCISCKRNAEEKKYDNPDHIKAESVIKWKKEVFKIGSGVLLKPEVYEFNTESPEPTYELKSDVDPIKYPEYYRKKIADNVKVLNLNTPRPFIVGVIEEIVNKKDDIEISVRIFCRPEDTGSGILSYRSDLTLIYWTKTVITTSFTNVTGKCYITFSDNVVSASKWSLGGPLRFYFEKMFDLETRQFADVPLSAERIGAVGKGGKSKSKVPTSKKSELPPEWKKPQQPLRCMDMFAGCGGLTEGLHQSGVCDTKWAIELEPTAADAFRKNFPNAKVFTEDCNLILKEILDGKAAEKGLPLKGQVEMLVGGPPCQGFSGMNRFKAGQYSHFKNSLVTTYLSYCEYYRPKYFMLENVRNFVSFKKGMILKLTISCLTKMGYQVTWGIMQAGHYGVPQTRRRLILIAAAPGYSLPRYPEPLYVFNKRGSQLSFVIDNSKFTNGCDWTESTPFRTITVKDAMGDLPEIKNGSKQEEMRYDSEASSHFQRMMRDEDGSLLRDHVCKEMPPIAEARIAHIPTTAGSDWRDLPNIVVKLNDGTSSTKLLYPYKTKTQRLFDPLKGVCVCVTGKPCDPTDRQFNTLVPWCLPHTGDRHNNWAGLYGRLGWNGYFGTTITNPEPMGKQGRVLHPEQNRVVSVRECARSQGFPDKFRFQGSILDKHRQIGNAVPPPMALALGREILKALKESMTKFE